MAQAPTTTTPAEETEKKVELRFKITVRGAAYELDLLKMRGRERALIEEQTGEAYGECVINALVSTGIKTVPQYYLAAIAVARTQKSTTGEIAELAEDLLDDEPGVVSFEFIGDDEDEAEVGPTKSKLEPKPPRALSGAQS